MEGIRSLPSSSSDYIIEYQIDNNSNRKSYPLCPPKPTKVGRRRIIYKSDHLEMAPPKAVFFKKQVSLSTLYNPGNELTYFEQIFARSIQVGEGSFGKVFKVLSREDGNTYAIKQFKSEKIRNFGLAEVRNFEKIGEHQNCVQYFMSWEQNNIIYIQMECCQLNLFEYTKCYGKICIGQLKEILYDILNALEFIHKKKLIHLDVKPENIMMNRGYYKLTDFGLLVDLNEDETKLSSLSDGDSKYLALEVLDRIYTYACDIFSLGISILELATNIPLPTYGALWREVRSDQLPIDFHEALNKAVTPELVHIINQMMLVYHKRPPAETILNYPEFTDIRNKDLNGLRKCRSGWFDRLYDNNNTISIDNNAIIETPRRPLPKTPTTWPEINNNEEPKPGFYKLLDENMASSFKAKKCLPRTRLFQ